MAWGGKRFGSGRKKKPKGVDSARILPHTATVVPDTPEQFEPPDYLTADERAVWVRQAAVALENGTLVRATLMSFERYCRMVVMEADEAKSTGRGAAAHLRMVARVNDYELQFLLTANGKPLAVPKGEAAPAESKLARFRRT